MPMMIVVIAPPRYRRSAFGSHVAEGILHRLGAAADAGLADDDAAALDELLDGLARAVGDQLHDYLMDRHATHVARALLRVAAGRDVVPASKQGRAKQQEQREAGGGGSGGGGFGAAAGAAQGGPAAPVALAEKLQGSRQAGAAAPPPRFPSLLSRLVRMLPCHDPPSMATLAKNSYSGPFLQGALRAVAGDRCALFVGARCVRRAPAYLRRQGCEALGEMTRCRCRQTLALRLRCGKSTPSLLFTPFFVQTSSLLTLITTPTHYSALLNHVLPPMLGVSAAAAAAAEPGSVLASVTESHMSKLLRDDVYSRLLEVRAALCVCVCVCV